MTTDDAFDAMVDACRTAHEAVMDHGTVEMQTFADALPHAWPREAARRPKAGLDGCGKSEYD